MPPLPSIELDEQRQMLQLARAAIRAHWHPGCDNGPELPHGQLKLGCFVSLHLQEQLRGCIGTLKADRPLQEAIPYFARAAAFNDPRFYPLTEQELAELTLSLSLLGESQLMDVSSREELLAALRPGEDGLWLSDGYRHATFLPCVWQQLPKPALFVEHLLRKGGWHDDSWPATMRAYRYPTLEFSEADISQNGSGQPLF